MTQSEEEFRKNWNDVMKQFKMSENFFKDNSSQQIMAAFEQLCLYAGFDIDVMKQASQENIDTKLVELNIFPQFEMVPMFNILRFIFKAHENVSRNPKKLCLYDLYVVGSKRLFRIFRELHNFILFFKNVNEQITVKCNNKNTAISDKINELASLEGSIEATEKEIKSIDNKTQKYKSALPQLPDEYRSLEELRENLSHDIEELESQIVAEKKEKLGLLENQIKIIQEIKELKDLIVEDPGTIYSALNSQKKECEEWQQKNSLEETSIKNKINLMNDKKKTVELANLLLTEFDKCNGLADQCNKIIEDKIDDKNANNLKEELKFATSSLNTNKKILAETSSKFEELVKIISSQNIQIDNQIQAAQEEKLLLKKENSTLNTVTHKASLVIAEYENQKKKLIDQMENIDSYVLDLINQMHVHAKEKTDEFEKNFREML